MVCRATNLNHTLASLLKKLSDRANDEEKQEIIDALEDVGPPSHTARILT